MKHNIIDDLLPLATPIGKLSEDPANARVHGKRNLSAIKGSLTRYGQRKPLVVNLRTGGVVEAGNGTLVAAIDLGWTHVAVVWVDDDPSTATGYAIADNRTAELAQWDDAALAALLSSVTELPEDAVGFSQAETDALLTSVGNATLAGVEPPEEFGEPDLSTNTVCPKCSYEWSQGK